MRCLEATVDSPLGFDAAKEQAFTLATVRAGDLELELDWSGLHNLSAKVINDGRWEYRHVLRVPIRDNVES